MDASDPNKSVQPQPAAATPPAATQTTDTGHALREFYCRPLPDGRTRYGVWESGEACGDSVTPSTYCPEYRNHMVLKILSLSRPQGRVFSIGCGNAFVETDLQARGLRVQAIDYNDEAVALAVAKGVDAFAADFYQLPPGHLADFGVVYADGLLGHVYRPETGLDSFFTAMRELGTPAGSWLVLSNDAPARSDLGVTPHATLAGFWLFSRDYLREVVSRAGYTFTEIYSFPYERPVSGLRNRTICIARRAASAAG